MGRWGWRVYVAVSRIASASKSINNPNLSRHPLIRSQNSPLISRPRNYFSSFRHFSALPASPPYVEEFDSRNNDFDANKILEELFEDDEAGNISVRAFFLCTRLVPLFYLFMMECNDRVNLQFQFLFLICQFLLSYFNFFWMGN